MHFNCQTEQKKQCTVTALPIKKSYKSHCKTIKNKHQLAVAFFAFWAIKDSLEMKNQIITKHAIKSHGSCESFFCFLGKIKHVSLRLPQFL